MLILLFGSVPASVEKPGVFNLFLSHLFFMLSSKRGFLNPAFQTQLFKTQVLTQPDFENPKRIHFKPEKGHFWFTLKGPEFTKYCSQLHPRSPKNPTLLVYSLLLIKQSFISRLLLVFYILTYQKVGDTWTSVHVVMSYVAH